MKTFIIVLAVFFFGLAQAKGPAYEAYEDNPTYVMRPCMIDVTVSHTINANAIKYVGLDSNDEKNAVITFNDRTSIVVKTDDPKAYRAWVKKQIKETCK